ncbi:MAG: hypothetical protein K0Q46_904 [Rhodococcus erythropolis]|jgi:arylsulfatase A-like enzyme|nr:sulfatase [Rhodococcus erythropolis]MDF2894118.1 hypothetical protein [Rhodococcus erythropolis]
MRILYLDVDTLRADHTTPYGYDRDTTPNLQRLADKGVTFDRYYCSDSPCLPSRTALISGQFGITNGVVSHFGEGARFRLDSGHGTEPDRPLLGQLLESHDHLPAVVSMFGERHRANHFTGSFREAIRATGNTRDEQAHEINAVGIDWIQRHADQEDWYLHLTYWDPHTPYSQPYEWTEKAAAAGPAPAWPDQATIEAHREIYGPHSALDLHYAYFPQTSPTPSMPDAIETRADFEHLINGFDGAVMYWDHHLGLLMDELERLGIADSTAIVVSADHGESFGENGSYAEHGLANESTHRIPLIVYWPGVTDDLTPEQRRNDALLYNIDYAPTIAELIGAEQPAGWQGTSFAAAIRGSEIESREYLVLGHGAHTYQRSVRTKTHLYTRTYHPGAFRAEWEQLFDMSADPHQTTDILDEQPELAAHMRSLLQQWWDEYAGRPGCLPDPMQTSLQTGPTHYNDPQRYVEHLRATGRSHLADHLAEQIRRPDFVVPVASHTEAPPRLAEIFIKNYQLALARAERSTHNAS